MRDWASIPKQTVFADRENNVRGDCWRCCVAAILNMDAQLLPNFCQEYDAMMYFYTQAWLQDRGYTLIKVYGEHNIYVPPLPRSWKDLAVGFTEVPLPTICSGPTVRTQHNHSHHAAIYIDDQLVYDPHPSNDGLTSINARYLIFRLAE